MNCILKYVNELSATEQRKRRKKEVEKKRKIPAKNTSVIVHRIKLKGKTDQMTFDNLPWNRWSNMAS